MLSESPYKRESATQIGLGPKILSRVRLMLGSLLLILTIVIIAGVHQGVTSGDFDRVLLKPFRQFAADFTKATEAPSSQFIPIIPIISTPSATIKSEPKSSTTKYSSPKQTPTQAPQSSTDYTKSYEQAKKQQDEWWAKVQAENQKLSEQSKKDLENFRQQSQQNLKQFEQQGQTGLEQFRQESEQKMEEFRQKYGIQ